MTRKRGRPRGPAKLIDDASLVLFVRNAKDRGMTVRRACEAYRTRKRRGNVDSIVKRYERIATAFPNSKVERTLLVFGVPVKNHVHSWTVLGIGGLRLARELSKY